jgi:hypothetical protein
LCGTTGNNIIQYFCHEIILFPEDKQNIIIQILIYLLVDDALAPIGQAHRVFGALSSYNWVGAAFSTCRKPKKVCRYM